MPEVTINVDVESRGTDPILDLAKLRELLAEGFVGILEEWGEKVLLPSVRSAWPDPEWPPLKPATVRRKQRLGQPLTPLIASGALIESATVRGAAGNLFRALPFELTVGTAGGALPYAAAQYYGVPERNLPARPWMEFEESEGDPTEQLLEMIDAAITESG